MLFFAKKLPNAQARGRRCVCGQCDGNGGVRNCGGVALVSDLSDLSDPSDKVVRHGIPRGFAERSLVWRGREYAGG